MRLRSIALLALTVSSLLIPASSLAQAPTGVVQLMDAWVAMWNRYDLSAVEGLFVADQTVTYFSSERDGLITGIVALRRHHEGFGFVAGGKDQPNRLTLEQMETRLLGDGATVLAEWRFHRPDGSVQRGPVSFVLVRTGAGWRIAHAHFGNAIRSGG